jgi:hypothetical protein
MFTDDPLKDFDRHDAEEQEWLDKLPKCAYCGEPIQDEECYVFDGDIFHIQCVNENHRKRTEEYYQD